MKRIVRNDRGVKVDMLTRVVTLVYVKPYHNFIPHGTRELCTEKDDVHEVGIPGGRGKGYRFSIFIKVQKVSND